VIKRGGERTEITDMIYFCARQASNV